MPTPQDALHQIYAAAQLAPLPHQHHATLQQLAANLDKWMAEMLAPKDPPEKENLDD